MRSNLNDEELIRQCRDSQPNDCFEELYSRYVDKVYRRCLSITQDSEKAHDFTHDIFLKMFAKLEMFQERSSFSTWLYSISHNYCMDQLRLAKRMPTDSIDEDDSDRLADSDEGFVVEERHRQLEQVMAQLSSDEVTLLRLKYERNCTIEQIARQYGVKECAIKMRLKRSRDKIQRLYEQQYGG